MVHELTRQQARRIAVRAQLLDLPRPTDALEAVRRLWVVQVDLTAAVAPSAHLVMWSRLGRSYRPEHLDALVVDRAVVEHEGMLRVAGDMALFRADMRDWPAFNEVYREFFEAPFPARSAFGANHLLAYHVRMRSRTCGSLTLNGSRLCGLIGALISS